MKWMAGGHDRRIFRILELLLETVRFDVVFDQAALIDRQRLADLHVLGKHSFAPGSVGDDRETVDPGGSIAGHFTGRANKAVLAGEVLEVDTCVDIEATIIGQTRDGTRNMKVTQRISGSIRVTPEPMHASAEDSVHHTVRADHLGVDEWLRNWRWLTNEHCVAVDAGAGDTIQPLGDIAALHFERRLTIGGDA